MLRSTLCATVSLVLIAGVATPASVAALSFDSTPWPLRLLGFEVSTTAHAATHAAPHNIQTLPLLQAAMNTTKEGARGGGEVSIADESALVPEEGPSGAGADIVRAENSMISIYVVREGDTLSEIAQMFNVSVNTIVWGNDLSRGSSLKIGQTLTILPITGIRYTVKKGDTLGTIAKAFHGDAEEIISYNDIDPATLAVGDQLIIPNGEVAAPPPQPAKSRAVVKAGGGAQSYSGYYMRPISGGTRTQGVHGYNGVDLAAPVGTPFMASASGDIIVARASGWNGGYGNYIVIRHDNGTQTLYAHASSVIVGMGQRVVQGQVIGYVGSTGRSTGAHLHFEIRGGPRNPF